MPRPDALLPRQYQPGPAVHLLLPFCNATESSCTAQQKHAPLRISVTISVARQSWACRQARGYPAEHVLTRTFERRPRIEMPPTTVLPSSTTSNHSYIHTYITYVYILVLHYCPAGTARQSADACVRFRDVRCNSHLHRRGAGHL